MVRSIPTVLVALLLAAPLASAQDAVSWAFEGGRWFDGSTFSERTWYAIGGTLTSVRPARVDSTVDLSGLWIVPPFGEAHNHNVDDNGLDETIRRYVEDGIFYVKNPGSIPRFIAEARPRVADPGTIDVTFAQGGWTGPGGHPLGLFRRNLERGVFVEDDGEGAFFRVVTTPAGVEAKWDDFLADDPDFVKLYLLYSEGPASMQVDGWRGLDPSVARAIVDRAHARGLRVSAHVETAADFRHALAAGVDEIAHLPGFRPGPEGRLAEPEVYRLDADDAARAAEMGVVVVTTASFVGDPEPADETGRTWREIVLHNLRTLHEGGVPLAVGSDRYGTTSRGEAEWLAGTGVFTNLEMLRTWTGSTPRTIYPTRRIGRFADGWEASFLALRRNPLDDFAATGEIVHRFKQGRRLVP